MSDATQADDSRPASERAGQQLRIAREAQDLALADIASRTRIPIRHLEAIEASNYADLPSPTYAVGFAKAYARAVGADEAAIAREVRSEQANVIRPPEYRPYEMADPARVPSRGLAIAGVIVALVLVIGVALWFGSDMFRGSGTATPTPSAVAAAPPGFAPAPAPVASAAAAGPVTLTATARVWLRVYDGDDKTLFMKTLDEGEKYQVPDGANHPMINVGRPDKLQVSIGDRVLPPLGSGARAIKDVAVDPASLEARAATAAGDAPSPQPTASPSAAPSATATHASRSRDRPERRREPAPIVESTPAPLSNGIY